MLIKIHLNKETWSIEGELYAIKRSIEAAIVKKTFVEFKNDKGFLTFINPNNITSIEATDEYKIPKTIEQAAKEQEKITYTEEQLSAQPLLALGYGKRVTGTENML